MTSIVANVTHILDVAEILQPLIQWVSQKFCNHSKQSGCTRNSATFYTLDVAEILGPFIHWVLQKFYDHSYSLAGSTLKQRRNTRNLKQFTIFCKVHFNRKEEQN